MCVFSVRECVCTLQPFMHRRTTTVICLCAVADCIDLGGHTGRCEEWAAAGECRTNPGYMVPNCRRSCGACKIYGESLDINVFHTHTHTGVHRSAQQTERTTVSSL